MSDRDHDDREKWERHLDRMEFEGYAYHSLMAIAMIIGFVLLDPALYLSAGPVFWTVAIGAVVLLLAPCGQYRVIPGTPIEVVPRGDHDE